MAKLAKRKIKKEPIISRQQALDTFTRTKSLKKTAKELGLGKEATRLMIDEAKAKGLKPRPRSRLSGGGDGLKLEELIGKPGELSKKIKR